MEPVTILLAEDNLVLGLFVKRVLQQAGYRVWFCMDVSEAWQYYADKNPDLILLDDNQQSGLNVKLAKKIRRENKIIPIVYLSGKTFESTFYNSTKLPADKSEHASVSEKNLLQHLHDMLPASKRMDSHAPVYHQHQMNLCSAEDILILTTFFEDSIHLRNYVLN